MGYKDPAIRKVKQKEFNRQHYLNNKDLYKQRAIDRKQEIRNWFNRYKEGLKCEYCGENHPACIDFHHNNPEEKKIPIAKMVSGCFAPDKILAEIEKCTILCANCHRKKHYEDKIGSMV